jgi:nucleoside-diphosphate-sugar epimerase
LINKISKGEEVALNNFKGQPYVNPTHISDLCEYLKALLDTDYSGVLNIAGEEILSIKEIAEIIAIDLNKKPKFKIHNLDIDNLIGNTDKIRHLTGYRPKVRFRQGIKDILKDIK